MAHGTYSLGLCGYKIWPDPEDDNRMMAKFVAVEGKNHSPRSYLVQYTKAGKPFIRPYGRRIYLDEVLCF